MTRSMAARFARWPCGPRASGTWSASTLHRAAGVLAQHEGVLHRQLGIEAAVLEGPDHAQPGPLLGDVVGQVVPSRRQPALGRRDQAGNGIEEVGLPEPLAPRARRWPGLHRQVHAGHGPQPAVGHHQLLDLEPGRAFRRPVGAGRPGPSAHGVGGATRRRRRSRIDHGPGPDPAGLRPWWRSTGSATRPASAGGRPGPGVAPPGGAVLHAGGGQVAELVQELGHPSRQIEDEGQRTGPAGQELDRGAGPEDGREAFQVEAPRGGRRGWSRDHR